MDRKRLMKQLRRVQRLARARDDAQRRLDRLCVELSVTDQELAMLLKRADGYVVVCDSRDQAKHVTLSGADAEARLAAEQRAQARAAAKQRKEEQRREDIKAEREAAKKHRVERKLEKARELAEMLKAAGMPLSLIGAK